MNTPHTPPLFSVLIANYNNGKYLMDAVESVKAQTYPNWEIILVDDGSTDNAEEVYTKLSSEERIHIFRNGENKGCGYTKRKCVELAHGEICGFLDADDTLTKDALEVMVGAHINNPEVSLTYSLFNETDQNLNFIRLSTLQRPVCENETLLDTQVVSHFVTFKKACYNKTKGINPFFKCAVDHDLYYKLEEVGDLLFVDKVLYNYRTNTGNNISLDKNAEKAFFGHLLAKVDACRRRGLDDKIEEFVASELSSHIDSISKEAADKVRNTHAYRLGRTLLKLFKI